MGDRVTPKGRAGTRRAERLRIIRAAEREYSLRKMAKAIDTPEEFLRVIWAADPHLRGHVWDTIVPHLKVSVRERLPEHVPDEPTVH